MARVEDAILKNLQVFVAFARNRLGDHHLAEDAIAHLAAARSSLARWIFHDGRLGACWGGFRIERSALPFAV